MDRQQVFPGAIPLETDLLSTNKNTMIALAKLAAAVFGTSTFVNGLAVTQTTVPSMQVSVAPGEIYALANVDSTAYSSLTADTTHQIVKQGINLDATLLTLTAPGTSGFSVNYLIQATFAETDTTPVVLPYYNASNPATAYSGPNNTGATNNTKRQGVVTLSAKAGGAATTGTQSTPIADNGYIGLASVTVAYGQTSITGTNISAVAGAPVLPAGGLIPAGFQGSYFEIANASGTANAIAASYAPGIVAISHGMLLYVRAALGNTTTTPTFTPNSGVIATKNIVKGAGAALAIGDIAGAGHWLQLQYDATLDKWVLLNPAKGVTNSASGNLGGFYSPATTSATLPTAALGNLVQISPSLDGQVYTLSSLASVFAIGDTQGYWLYNSGGSGPYAVTIKANASENILTVGNSFKLYPQEWCFICNQNTSQWNAFGNAAALNYTGSGVPIGVPVPFMGPSANVPAGWLVVPTAPSTLSRTAYARLFAAIGTTFGAGDGATTFGCPYIPLDFAITNNAGAVGTTANGENIAHVHTYTKVTTTGNGAGSASYQSFIGSGTDSTGSTGGSANLPAAMRGVYIMRY